MERFMNIIKERSKYKTISHVEKSYLLNIEATHRSLMKNRAMFGCTTLKPERPVDLKSATTMLGVGKRIIPSLRASQLGLTCDDARMLTRAALRFIEAPVPNAEDILDSIAFFAYARAELCGIKIYSSASSSARVGCRSYQSSFVRVSARHTIAVDPSSAPATRLISIRGCMYAYVQCYFRAVHHRCTSEAALARQSTYDASDEVAEEDLEVGDYAVLQMLVGARQEVFVGTRTIVTNVPSRSLPCEQYWIAPLEAIQSQLLVLKARSDRNDVRFVECPGKLVVSSM
jgi:hypothetical protein